MPLYEFRCNSCGEFEAWRTLAELNSPMPCPICAAEAKRLFSPPMVNLSSSSLSSLGRQETKEPRLVKLDKEPSKSRYQNPASGRPWMIGHAPPRY
ncbi:zinc ribbon domain-containing protein [Pleurocapsales cyanobacterium LEGE 06147]|nr:zinc ribbon domain-containing protein [Pleurocapsales cyanobacterium LEGE 06147]